MADASTDPGGPGAAQAAHAAPTILAVDDDADVLRATERILWEAGFHVLTGATAAEALELTRRHHPALVLLDVMLPDGNGVDVARRLKSDPALADVFVILCSGAKTSRDDQARGLAEGLADGYMARPLSKPELLARIDAFLRIRETQRALRESEARFRALVEWTPEAIVVHRGGKLIYVNPAAITMFGATSAEDLIGKPILELIHPDCHQIVLDRVKKALDTNVGAPQIALRYLKLDGTTIEAEVQGTPIVYDGEPAIHVALRDVTTRKRAEEALREREAIFRSIVEQAVDAIGLVDVATGRFIELNDAACRNLGYSRDELAALGLGDIDLQWPGEGIVQALADLQATGVNEFETRHRRKDGEIRDVRVTASMIDVAGRALFSGIWSDITERKQAEEELRETRDFLEKLFGCANAPIIVWDAELRITRFNRAFEELTGRTAEEVVGKRLELLFPEDERRAQTLELVTSASAGERWQVVEIPILREGGEVRTVLWSSATLYAGDGVTPVATIAQSQDITARMQAEEALREREAIFRSIVEQAVDAIGLVEVATGRFIELNDAACRNLGYGRDELASLSLADIDLQWPGDGMVQRLADLNAKGADAFETRHRRKDGEVRDVRVRATVIEVAGRPCLAAIWSDITASKLAHEELGRHRQHLEEMVAARTEELSAANRILAEGAADLARWRQNFDTFFNTTDDLLFVLDAGGAMIHVNATVYRRLGYSEAELLGRPVLDVLPPERRDEAGRIVAAMLAGEADFCPIPVVTKDGAEIPVETRVVPGVWDGRPALFAVAKDISALRVSEDKFQRLFHGNPALMAVSSLPERRYAEVNEAFLNALGYSREEVLGHTTDELGLAVDPQQQRAVADQLQAQGRVSDCELKVRRKDGAILDGLFSGEIIESQGQQYFLTVMIDQTERRQAEEALRESEALYRSILSATPDNVTVTDLEGRVRMASPAGLAMFGKAREEEVVGRSLIEFLAPEDWERAQAYLARMREGANQGPDEYRGLRADGSDFAIDVNAELIRDADDQPTGMVLIARDITERKQAGEDLLESLAEQQSITEGVIVALARTVEVRDPYTAGHQRRVSELAVAMALQMGLGEERAEGVRVGGMLHDVGKITIPAEILSKPGLLSLMEFGLIKGHAQSGFEILAAIHFPWPVAEMALQHHERPDGSGYPRGLEGEQILLEARILAVADVVEAMSSHRPYRPALGLEAALAEVRSGAGVRYDADTVAACESVFAQGFVFSEA